jgi:hypothetical protein
MEDVEGFRGDLFFLIGPHGGVIFMIGDGVMSRNTSRTSIPNKNAGTVNPLAMELFHFDIP